MLGRWRVMRGKVGVFLRRLRLGRSAKNEFFLIVGAGLLIPVVLLALWSVHLLQGTLLLQKHSIAVQSVLADISARIKYIEIFRERRGEHARDIDNSYRALDRLFADLEKLVTADQVQLESLYNVREKSTELRTADIESSLVRVEIIDQMIQAMDSREQEKTAFQETELNRWINQLNRFTIGIGIIAVCMVLFAGFSFRRESKIRKQMMDALSDSEQRAHSASMMKSRFLAAVSHEIRTPLNGIISLSDLLRTQKLTGDTRKYVDIIFSSSKTLLRIINDLLDFSKIESGKFVFESQAFSPADVVLQTASVLEPRANQKKVELATEIAPSVPKMVKGDFDRLAQVLYNLVGNAIKFTHSGSVKVQLKPSVIGGRQRLVFAIQDSGVGMSSEQKEKLFEPFQLNQPGTAGEQGSGLGLSIAKNLIQMMGGELRFESTLGQGSRFWFDLPFENLSPEMTGVIDETCTSVKEPLPNRMRSLQILVVEDNPTNQTVAQSLLERLGLRVQIAANGKDALALLNLTGFDLVFMDCQMPVMDGLETTKHIRKTPGLAKIPVIAMTANVTEEDRQNCKRAGMNDFLLKPFLIEDLRAMIVKWLGQEVSEKPMIEPAVLDRLRSTVGSLTTSRVLHSFIGTLPEFRAQASDFLRDRNNEKLSQLAHRFKSSASAIGALDFAEKCKTLESITLTEPEQWEKLIDLSYSLEDEAKREYQVAVQVRSADHSTN